MRLTGWILVVLLCVGTLPGARATEAAPLDEQLHDHRGRIVVLNFWAAWCGPCKNEMPLLAELQREYEERGVQVLGASTDAPNEREEAEELLSRSGVEYPIVFGLSDTEMRQLGLGALIPATAIFDRDGARVFRLVGEATRTRLAERLEWLLGERAGRPPRELVLPAGVDASDYEE